MAKNKKSTLANFGRRFLWPLEVIKSFQFPKTRKGPPLIVVSVNKICSSLQLILAISLHSTVSWLGFMYRCDRNWSWHGCTWITPSPNRSEVSDSPRNSAGFTNVVAGILFYSKSPGFVETVEFSRSVIQNSHATLCARSWLDRIQPHL
jgi:hypothetical protein